MEDLIHHFISIQKIVYHFDMFQNALIFVCFFKVHVRHLDKLQCSQAKSGQRYVMNLKALGDSKHARISQALTVLLVILVLILVTLLAAYVYLKKDTVKQKLSPLLDAVGRKVQYTTIESQEV